MNRGGYFIKIIRAIILLIPVPFLFHFIEISLRNNGSLFAIGTTLLFIILAGLLSVRMKVYHILLIHILNVLLSVWLGAKFITPPNDSWFNPFDVNGAIIFTGIIILIGLLVIRFILKDKLLKVGNILILVCFVYILINKKCNNGFPSTPYIIKPKLKPF